METLRRTVRAITSKPAQRVIVNTVLLAFGAISLLCLAALATVLFFSNFVPDQFVTTPIHLQYGSSSHPYGIAQLPVSLLKSQQDYDISVTLSLPRSPANTERGNFMISLYLLDSTNTDPLDVNARNFANRQADAEQKSIVFHSRRPTLFPYTDPVVSLASRLLFLFYHMLVPSAQSCKMIVPLAERVVFDSSTIPASAYVEVEAGQGIQVYSTVLTMTAQLHGLRWLMFHYRAPTFVAFTFIFWAFELVFMSVAWGALSSTMGSSAAAPRAKEAKGKRPQLRDENDENDEDEDADDSEGEEDMLEDEQQVPRYQRGDSPKKEEEEDLNLADIPMLEAEADNEEEDNNNGGGQGSGYRQGQGSGRLRRRASRNMD